MPVLFFNGLTPDDATGLMTPENKARIGLPVSSRIAMGALRNGLSADEAHSLYSPTFCDLMGYSQAYNSARENLILQVSNLVPSIASLLEDWRAQGVFYHMSLHPKIHVIEDILRCVLHNQVQVGLPRGLSKFCNDPLQTTFVSPQLNHARATDLISDPEHRRKHGGTVISCRQFIDITYKKLAGEVELLGSDKAANAIFDTALTEWRDYRPRLSTTNPYHQKPDSAFWKRFVVQTDSSEINPTGNCKAVIGRETRVATAGSCFAQHVARAMVADGLAYHVTEPAPGDMSEDEALQKTYGLFSARFGNIYTSSQLLQLFQRAYGNFDPIETAWPVEGGFVDPFRPNIGEVFATPEALEESRDAHLKRVREMFETLEVFVFTMGLTEGWTDRRDGAAFPVPPAAVSTALDSNHFEFQNSSYTLIRDEMAQFIGALANVNPTARIVLTVSPVPLIATYTDSDVLSATTYSKSVLRSVAGDLSGVFENVSYFPSYEIITGPQTGGRYFEDDLRSVRPEGVAHVMRTFRETLVNGNLERLEPSKTPVNDKPDHKTAKTYSDNLEIVCDEEMVLSKPRPQTPIEKSTSNAWWNRLGRKR